MLSICHLNCGTLRPSSSPGTVAACHCLMLQEGATLALIDTGIGLLDCRHPDTRLGRPLIDLAGFQLNESDTAVRQLQSRHIDPAAITDILLTHADPDHTGGLADFPHATVHIAAEEHAALTRGHWRYLPAHFDHAPRFRTYPASAPSREWFGLIARPLQLPFSAELVLVPLPGHTHGHCGIAIRDAPHHWTLHAGDAYYLRLELDPATPPDHPIHTLTTQRADDNPARLRSLAHLQRLARDHAGEIHLLGYHDFSEFPPAS